MKIFCGLTKFRTKFFAKRYYNKAIRKGFKAVICDYKQEISYIHESSPFRYGVAVRPKG